MVRVNDMFKHILLPTDGSELSEAAIRSGIQFAKSVNAKVLGLHVITPYSTLTVGPQMLTDNDELYAKNSRRYAEQYLSFLDETAKEAGVTCETVYVFANHVYEAIIRTAEEKGCDLVAMSTHGHQMIADLLLGTTAIHVQHSISVPVLLLRAR